MPSNHIEILYFILGITIDISNMVLNFLLAYALKKLNKLKIVSYWFIFWLCVSDCFVGLAGFSYHIQLLLKVDIGFVAAQFARNFLLQYSKSIIITIAIDRCIHMKLLMRYSELMTMKRSYIVLISDFILVTTVTFIGWYAPYILLLLYLAFFVFFFAIYLWTYFSIKNRVTGSGIHSEVKICNAEFPPEQKPQPSQADNNDNCNIMVNTCFEVNSKDNCQNTAGNAEVIQDEIYKAKLAKKKDGDRKENGRHSSEKTSDKIRCFMKSGQSLDARECRRRRPEAEFGKAMVFILAAYTVSYIPVVCLLAYELLSGKMYSVTVLQYVKLLAYCNSSFNAVIFISFSTELRRYLKTLSKLNST